MAARTSFVGKPLACAGRVGPRATQVACRSVTRAQVAEVAVLNETGEKTGTKQLDLKFAGESSKGLVHRYVVHVLRNQVSLLRKRQKRDRKGLVFFFFQRFGP